MPDGREDPRDVKPSSKEGDAPGEPAVPADAGAAEAVNGAGAASGQPERQTKTSGSAKSNWKPTQRVLDMTSEMIDEIRQRLNVAVENGDNEETGARAAPIESFHDMVSWFALNAQETRVHASPLKRDHESEVLT